MYLFGMKLKGSIVDNELVFWVLDFKMIIIGRYKIQVIVVFIYCCNFEGLLLINIIYKFYCEKIILIFVENEMGICNY